MHFVLAPTMSLDNRIYPELNYLHPKFYLYPDILPKHAITLKATVYHFLKYNKGLELVRVLRLHCQMVVLIHQN